MESFLDSQRTSMEAAANKIHHTINNSYQGRIDTLKQIKSLFISAAEALSSGDLPNFEEILKSLVEKKEDYKKLGEERRKRAEDLGWDLRYGPKSRFRKGVLRDLEDMATVAEMGLAHYENALTTMEKAWADLKELIDKGASG